MGSTWQFRSVTPYRNTIGVLLIAGQRPESFPSAEQRLPLPCFFCSGNKLKRTPVELRSMPSKFHFTESSSQSDLLLNEKFLDLS